MQMNFNLAMTMGSIGTIYKNLARTSYVLVELEASGATCWISPNTPTTSS